MLNSQFKFKKEEFKKNVQDNVKTLYRRTIDEATRNRSSRPFLMR